MPIPLPFGLGYIGTSEDVNSLTLRQETARKANEDQDVAAVAERLASLGDDPERIINELPRTLRPPGKAASELIQKAVQNAQQRLRAKNLDVNSLLQMPVQVPGTPGTPGTPAYESPDEGMTRLGTTGTPGTPARTAMVPATAPYAAIRGNVEEAQNPLMAGLATNLTHALESQSKLGVARASRWSKTEPDINGNIWLINSETKEVVPAESLPGQLLQFIPTVTPAQLELMRARGDPGAVKAGLTKFSEEARLRATTGQHMGAPDPETGERPLLAASVPPPGFGLAPAQAPAAPPQPPANFTPMPQPGAAAPAPPVAAPYTTPPGVGLALGERRPGEFQEAVSVPAAPSMGGRPPSAPAATPAAPAKPPLPTGVTMIPGSGTGKLDENRARTIATAAPGTYPPERVKHARMFLADRLDEELTKAAERRRAVGDAKLDDQLGGKEAFHWRLGTSKLLDPAMSNMTFRQVQNNPQYVWLHDKQLESVEGLETVRRGAEELKNLLPQIFKPGEAPLEAGIRIKLARWVGTPEERTVLQRLNTYRTALAPQIQKVGFGDVGNMAFQEQEVVRSMLASDFNSLESAIAGLETVINYLDAVPQRIASRAARQMGRTDVPNADDITAGIIPGTRKYSGTAPAPAPAMTEKRPVSGGKVGIGKPTVVAP